MNWLYVRTKDGELLRVKLQQNPKPYRWRDQPWMSPRLAKARILRAGHTLIGTRQR